MGGILQVDGMNGLDFRGKTVGPVYFETVGKDHISEKSTEQVPRRAAEETAPYTVKRVFSVAASTPYCIYRGVSSQVSRYPGVVKIGEMGRNNHY